MGTSKNVFQPMRQRSTPPMKWALAFATARVLAEKIEFLEVAIWHHQYFYEAFPLALCIE